MMGKNRTHQNDATCVLINFYFFVDSVVKHVTVDFKLLLSGSSLCYYRYVLPFCHEVYFLYKIKFLVISS